MTATLAQLEAGKLQGSSTLSLAAAGLTQFPQALYTLADTLEVLDLNSNALTALPNDLYRFKKLRILFCSFNQLTQLPENLNQCPQLSMMGFKNNQITHIPESAIPTATLRWFIVTDNALTQLPDSLGQCSKLQKVMLAGNQLNALPASMAQCQHIELLRISANQLDVLPDWLFSLPKLSWLAYAGNPFCNAIEQMHADDYTVPSIDWSDLLIGAVLGEGASGITYQAAWQSQQQTVAVKLFKGGMTSDGLPGSEMHANLLAGQHPNLVGVIGKINSHPDNKIGLVMPLLDPSLNILAGPPSFASCSRDVYDDKLALTTEQVIIISRDIASATAHLHQQGLMHGDLYAHNILWHQHQAVLSDLGGASSLPNNPEIAIKVSKLESHAFGILLAELLTRSPSATDKQHPLWHLQQQCTASAFSKRPTLIEIAATIQQL